MTSMLIASMSSTDQAATNECEKETHEAGCHKSPGKLNHATRRTTETNRQTRVYCFLRVDPMRCTMQAFLLNCKIMRKYLGVSVWPNSTFTMGSSASKMYDLVYVYLFIFVLIIYLFSGSNRFVIGSWWKEKNKLKEIGDAFQMHLYCLLHRFCMWRWLKPLYNRWYSNKCGFSQNVWKLFCQPIGENTFANTFPPKTNLSNLCPDS